MMTLHFLNDVANTKIENYVLIASLTTEIMLNWLIEYQARVFWYQVYQAQLWERMLKHSASLAMSTSILKALSGKLDIKKHSPTVVPTKSDSDVVFCLQW